MYLILRSLDFKEILMNQAFNKLLKLQIVVLQQVVKVN